MSIERLTNHRAGRPAALAFLPVAALSLWLALPPLTARAHEGHDHGPTPPVAMVSLLPRAAVTTEAVEMVAVLEGTTLRLWLDHAASNAPLLDAEVEVELAGTTLAAPLQADGSHALSLPAPLAVGSHTLHVSVIAGDVADLLSATLEISAGTTASAGAQPPAPAAAGFGLLPMAASAAAGAVIALIAMGWRGKRVGQPRPGRPQADANREDR